MSKNLKTILIVLGTMFFLSCGYKPINLKDNETINLQNIKIEGEKRIAYSIKNNVLLVSNNKSNNKYNALIKVKKKKSSKIKNKAGKVTRYDLTLTVDLILTDIENKSEYRKTFLKKLDYNISKIHSDTINNENNTAKIITQQISDEINNYINLLMRNK